MAPSLPDGARGVEDPTRREAVTARLDGSAGRRAVRIAAHQLVEQAWPRRPMDRSVHATATTERRVGGVGDRVDRLARDVAGLELQAVVVDVQAPGRHRLIMAQQIVAVPAATLRDPNRPSRDLAVRA